MGTTKIHHLIVAIDDRLTQQLHEIMQHPALQELQATWTGLHYLVTQVKKTEPVKISILNVSWQTLCKDMHRSSDVEHSALFDKINNLEFGMPGGEPFALIIGDYQLDINSVTNRHCVRDMQALKAMAQISAMSFTLFVSGIKATAFGFETYRQFSGQGHLSIDATAINQTLWQRFRQSEEARFIGLVLPRFLLNQHYQRVVQISRCYYGAPNYIWGNAVYAYAAVFARSFVETGWFLDALGMPNDKMPSQGGLLPNISAPPFIEDETILPDNLLTKVIISDQQEQALNNAGFTVLSQLAQIPWACFIHSPSLKSCGKQEGLLTAEQLSCLLPYLLCICRFAHYLKIIGRDKLGQYKDNKTCERELQTWLNQYIASNTDITTAMKARFPLTAGDVKIMLQPGHEAHYICSMRLSPQLKTQQTSASVLLKTALTPIH